MNLFNLKWAVVVACMFAFVACGGEDEPGPVTPPDETVEVTGVTLNKTELTLIEGEDETLTAEVKPGDATDKTVKWSVDKPEVASVEGGLVTAIAEGTAVITVTTTDGDHKATCALTVEKKDTPSEVEVTGVELNINELTLTKNASETLTATVTPEGATDKRVTWSSSAPDRVSVDNTGYVTALESGDPVTITVKTVDGGFEDECVVTVAIPVIDVELSTYELALEKDKKATITAILLPGMAINQNVTWKTSNSNVVSINPDGLDCEVTGVAAGTAIITVTTQDGEHEASCEVTVTAAHPLFGEISFRTPDTKTIGNQIWSDMVIGAGCPTDNLDSGYQSSPKAACRNISGKNYGTFYSWPAVVEYKDVLCPDGWRVPTVDDFNKLHTALGGTLDSYLNTWGAELAGDCSTGSMYSREGQQGKYWSQTSESQEYAYSVFLTSNGQAIPNQRQAKHHGYNLRCVKDAN